MGDDVPTPRDADDGPGSCLTGTVAQVVSLGTRRQFHVETATGRPFVVHELSTEGPRRSEEGDAVTLTWPGEDTAILRVDRTTTR
jgi:hypothetical protein